MPVVPSPFTPTHCGILGVAGFVCAMWLWTVFASQGRSSNLGPIHASEREVKRGILLVSLAVLVAFACLSTGAVWLVEGLGISSRIGAIVAQVVGYLLAGTGAVLAGFCVFVTTASRGRNGGGDPSP